MDDLGLIAAVEWCTRHYRSSFNPDLVSCQPTRRRAGAIRRQSIVRLVRPLRSLRFPPVWETTRCPLPACRFWKALRPGLLGRSMDRPFPCPSLPVRQVFVLSLQSDRDARQQPNAIMESGGSPATRFDRTPHVPSKISTRSTMTLVCPRSCQYRSTVPASTPAP